MAKTLFDLISPSAELQLKGPAGEELPVKLRVQGLNVATIKQKALEANAFLMQAQKTDNVDLLVKTLVKAEKTAGEMAALAIVGWDNDEFMGGPYTPEYCREVLAKPEMEFLRKEVNQFITDQTNFFRDKPVVVANDPELAA